MSDDIIKQTEKILDSVLATELSSVIKSATAKPGSEDSLLIKIPDGSEVEYSPEQLSSLVALTANNYQKACRQAGIANAVFKRAEGRYKRKFKKALGITAKNAQAREASALAEAEEEFSEMNALEAIVELAEYQEQACRVASESARKLLDKTSSIKIGSNREGYGQYRDEDFK